MNEAQVPLNQLRKPDFNDTQETAFLVRLYASTRAAELALVPWTDTQKEFFARLQATAQRQHYQAEYPAAEELLILVDAEPAGRLYVDRRATEIRLLDFSLLPEYHTSAAGRQVLCELMAEGAAAGKPVNIHLQPDDPLQSLFEQLGFTPAGHNGVHVLFEWRAT
jgi:predicted TIM-barrel fold metal-dependent hydrolase